MNPVANDILMHYGTPRHSGRYPWGSGKNPFQHSKDFLARIDELKSQGLSEKEIAEEIGLTTTQFRTQKSLARAERRTLQVEQAKALRSDGKSLNDIARIMGFKNDSSVRALLNEDAERRMNTAKVSADYLKKLVDESPYGMLDVGTGAERSVGGISREKLKEALYSLELQGYEIYKGGLPQVTNQGKQTNLVVLCKPGTEHKDIYQFDKISSIEEMQGDYILTDNGNAVKRKFEYPASLDSKRVKIRYAEEGGLAKDGLIELRPGVKDISLGEAHYAQVRILVDGTHYIKGMAVYNPDLPEGVDVLFNTNKTKGTPMLGPKDNTVLKNIKNDPTNPFGSLIKEPERGGQTYYDDPNGKFTDPITGKKQSLNLLNRRAEEGDWGEWGNELPSQFLAKQSRSMIVNQLNITKANKQAEFEEIKNLTNPTLKKHLLESFANDCDSAAVHLKAAALPRQRYQVILPLTTLKDNEIYAPNYKDGETVALVRFPHGGTFEIPILKVNNKNAEGNKIIGNNAKDGVGIKKSVANRLSGADFDGDTVMVIPLSDKVKITSTPALEGLKDFDPDLKYGGKPEGTFKKMTNTQNEMGRISNLITDMTLGGAKSDELAAAVRHSMVVIDAEKHGYDYKASERDNNIAALKKRYQGRIDPNTGRYKEGAGTIISGAKSETSVLKREGSPRINIKGKDWYDPSRPEGALLYKTAKDEKLYYEERVKVKAKDERGRIIRDEKGKPTYELNPETGKPLYRSTGKIKTRTEKSNRMSDTDDAFTLVSDLDNPKERAYADYANYMKSLANQARKEMATTRGLTYNSSANKTYSNEVMHLRSQLDISERNAPKERKAQMIANTEVEAKKRANPDITKAEEKKLRQFCLTEARNRVGANRKEIEITDRDWEAIQAGAISDNELSKIFKYTNLDRLRERATPRNNGVMSDSVKSQIKALSATYTNKQIADKLGISVSTVSKYV